ncbi:sensor histidine kinase [Longimicrobium sp.]|uniref:HAMP domain-containing sensor histidine kinase n=1 Tax=Longimicrobium sp. TaxID=2029185 RepID=UPI002BF624A4|nr:sensor histidine kinase [Longimicrobium sp.]HSU13329.1 sensor histidine kinase [Longimicrobium sp.]
MDDAPETDEPNAAPHAPPSRLPGSVRALLRIPLFYKILIANAVLVLVGTLFGTLVTARFVRDEPGASLLGFTGLLALIGIAVTLLVNAVILRVALRPLDDLERTAARVQRGELDRRAPVSPVADRELERLRRTFNAMLDTAAAYRTRLREVAARALSAAEEERKRIARELHDETAQMLAALLIRIRVVRNSRDPAQMEPLLDGMREDVSRALEGIRRFARGLRPPALDELGLVPAIEGHARSLEEIAGLKVELRADDVAGDLPPEAELATYRIVQEALSNVVRHARATRATVTLAHERGRLVVTVEDDGRGFDPDNVMSTEGGGLGLFGMKERAGYIGGRVEVASTPGTGTRVRAEIPLHDETPE